MEKTLRAYSLGYEGMSLDGYVETLKSHSISVVIDVRETPWSYKPGFSKKPLAERLEAEQIGYVHLKSAGNPARNRKLGLPQHEVIELYKEHLDADSSCLDEILRLIRSTSDAGAVCLLCFEHQPHNCHRKVILDRLGEQSKMMTCHLSGGDMISKKLVAPKRIPKTNDGKRTRKHVEVAQNKRRMVAV